MFSPEGFAQIFTRPASALPAIKTVERHGTMRVGFLVTPALAKYSEVEGVVKEISQARHGGRFRVFVLWAGATVLEEYRPRDLVSGQRTNFPDAESFFKSGSASWRQGVPHTWVRDSRNSWNFCGICGGIRVNQLEVAERPCRGPVKIALR